MNEPFLAAAVLVPFVQIRRPLPSNLAILASLAVLAVIVFGERTQVVTDLAETLGALVLAPIGFDVVDRGILDPHAPTSARLRYGWYRSWWSRPSRSPYSSTRLVCRASRAR